MPPITRKHVYLSLLGATGVLLIAGAVLLILAVSFEGYVSALLLWALAGCSFFGARELNEIKPGDPPTGSNAALDGGPMLDSAADAERHGQR
jgi:hypothetical protein